MYKVYKYSRIVIPNRTKVHLCYRICKFVIGENLNDTSRDMTKIVIPHRFSFFFFFYFVSSPRYSFAILSIVLL